MDKQTMKSVQRVLRDKGFDPGPIDGILGERTEKAIVDFKRSIGYRPRPYLGPLTLAALLDDRPDKQRKTAPSRRPSWLKLAYTYLGMKEIRGRRHNPKIIEWWKKLKLPFRDDETPWCAGFVNGVLQEAGFAPPPKNRAAALGWRWTGHGAKLPGPALGAVFSKTRRGRPGSGHTGYVAGRNRKGQVMILGGNQGNMVNIRAYSPTANDAQYHWPKGAPIPQKTGMHTLPYVNATGSTSRQET